MRKLLTAVGALTIVSAPAWALQINPVVTPEPQSFILMGAGLAVFAIVSWRRSKRNK